MTYWMYLLGPVNYLVFPLQITAIGQFNMIVLAVWKVLQDLLFFYIFISHYYHIKYYLLHLKCNYIYISEHIIFAVI